MRRNQYLGWVAACLAVGGGLVIAGHTAEPKQARVGDDMRMLQSASDPQMRVAWAQIQNGPKDLAREIAGAHAEGIDVGAAPATVPIDQDAGPLYDRWNALRKAKPMRMPNYASVPHYKYAYTQEQIAVLEHLVDDNRENFAQMHAASEAPKLAASTSAFSHYGYLREAAREVALESFVAANRGQMDLAVQDQTRGLHIASHAAGLGGIPSWLTGVAIESIALTGFQEILQRAGPNQAIDQKAARAIQSAHPVLSFKAALVSDVQDYFTLLEKIRLGTDSDLSALVRQAFDSDAKPDSTALTASERKFANNLIDATETSYLHEMRMLIAAADKPPTERRAIFAGIEQSTSNTAAPQTRLDPLRNTLAILLPPSSSIEEVDSRLQAREQVTLAAATVLETKAKTGAYPAALPEGFTDPFTGKTLSYRREGDNGFVVYSVGADGKFDGGAAGDAPAKQAVFRYPAPPQIPLPAAMEK